MTTLFHSAAVLHATTCTYLHTFKTIASLTSFFWRSCGTWQCSEPICILKKLLLFFYCHFCFWCLICRVRCAFEYSNFKLLWWRNLKVSRSQKQILKFSLQPRTNENNFFISALALWNGSNKKKSNYYIWWHIITDYHGNELLFFFDLTHLRG